MNLDATLDELEGPGWKDPDYPSVMVQRIRALGSVPVREFTPGDLRLVISQHRALVTLVPLALELLQGNPLLEGDLYPGDLLMAVAGLSPAFWGARPELHQRIRKLVASAIIGLDTLEHEDRVDVEPQLRQVYEAL